MFDCVKDPAEGSVLYEEKYPLRLFKADMQAYKLYCYMQKICYDKEYIPESSLGMIIHDK